MTKLKETILRIIADEGFAKEDTYSYNNEDDEAELKIEDFRSYADRMFEKALNNLHGKWNLLSKEEEELILKISKQF